MPGKQAELPRLLVEDYLSILRGLVALAWIVVTGGVLTELSIRSSNSFVWPETGTFSLIYNAVLIVFGLNTLALTALLVYRDWYERIPRESAPRVRWLMVVVMVWLAMHVLGAFHVTGALSGPFFLLLPVMLLAALVVFPGRAGWWTAGLLLAGHVLALFLGNTAVIDHGGVLASHFSYTPSLTPWGAGALFMIMLLTLVLAARIRGWLYSDGQSLSPAQRIDPDTGLFRRAFLNQRMAMELGRIRRQGGSAALLLIGLNEENVDQTTADMRTAATALIQKVRLASDTPAVYRPGILAVLLPAAGPDGADSAAKRLLSELAREGVSGQMRSAFSVVSHETVEPVKWMASAEVALQHAEPGGEPVVVAE